MTTNFPTGLDSFAPVPENQQTVVKHRFRHQNVEDAIEAIEAKVGVNGSAVTTSIDYKLSQFGLPGGSSGIGFIQAGAGATARTMQDKAREIISVKDYGAVGDGATNDAPAFNAAVAYLASLGGGTIHIPRGDYLLSSSVQIAQSGIYFVGEGPTASACRIINGTASQPAIQFGDGVNTFSRCGIVNVAFGQASGVATALGNCGLRGVKISNFSVEDIQVFNFPAALRVGMEFSACSQMYLSDCGVQGCSNNGIYIKDNTLDLYVSNCRSDTNATVGWQIEDSQGLYFVNCSGYGNTGNCWNLSTAGANGNLNLFFVNCIGDTSGSYDWVITQCSVGFFSNCWGSTQQSTVVNTFANGFILNGPKVNDITFMNPSALACNSHGMVVDQATRISIISPQFGSSYQPGVGNGKGSTGDGLKITGNASHVYVRGGISTGNSGYAVSIDSGATDIVIDGLYCLGNTAGTILNSANATTAQAVVTNCPGFNPLVNLVTTPAFPATTVPVTNLTGAPVTAYITGGTVTNISINGSFVLSSTPATVVIPPGANITITYTGSPLWKWIAD